ncbi:hypothetical protein NHX12_005791 [Muraenolepis orangiensis]|uniref:SET domain-containing protein n=1 Tax=Muraenolepis orangiensis TaxID=630683 RepID=A0A9Q0IE17_9TELE|nr:hypothetical protein NHX12_005791 [Muraenolepis orangiensis]
MSPSLSLPCSLSLLNHDCRPNCLIVFERTTLFLRAVRDIRPQEEDGVMLCGEESAWLPLKETIPRLESLQAESSILP